MRFKLFIINNFVYVNGVDVFKEKKGGGLVNVVRHVDVGEYEYNVGLFFYGS